MTRTDAGAVVITGSTSGPGRAPAMEMADHALSLRAESSRSAGPASH